MRDRRHPSLRALNTLSTRSSKYRTGRFQSNGLNGGVAVKLVSTQVRLRTKDGRGTDPMHVCCSYT
jgi:hypothetical protein